MGDRVRTNYLDSNNKIPFYPVTFFDHPIVFHPITFIENRYITIPGVAPYYYYANNIGQVFNVKGQLIKPCLINSGYYTYRLKREDNPHKYVNILAHRLFMITFNPVENMENLTVNHEDMNRANNRLDNLTWQTQADNNKNKNLNKPHDGSSNYKALFNYNQLKVIVEEIHKGTPYKVILSMIGVPDSKVNRDYVGNIKRGITYRNEVAQIKLELGIE